MFNVHPHLHAHSFEFNPSLLLLDVPAASNLLQSPGDARIKASGHLVDDILLNFHGGTDRTTDQSDNEKFQDAADSIDPELMASGMERTSTWRAMWIRVRELFRIGTFWLKNSLAEKLGEFENFLLHTP